MPNIGPFLSYVFVVTFTPGPNNILSMANASRSGYRGTLRFMLGIFSGFFILMMASSYFNLLLFDLVPKIKPFMSLLGAGYMLYLAYKIAMPHGSSKAGKKDSHRSINSFASGMTLQFVNIKVILYGITVISNFITPYYQTSGAFILSSFFLAGVAFASISCWALFGSLMSQFLSRHEKPFNISMALLLIYSAISISGLFH